MIGRKDDQTPDVPTTDIAIGTVSGGKNNFCLERLGSIGQGWVGAAREDQLQMTLELLSSFNVSVAKSEGVDTGPNGILPMHFPVVAACATTLHLSQVHCAQSSARYEHFRVSL